MDKILSMLGLAAKAGRASSGEFSVEKSITEGKAFLVIVAEDASDNTKKLFTNKCIHYNVPMIFYATKNELGHCIGKQFRSSVAVTDAGIANAIKKLLKDKTDMK
ncbi:L7Ae/L30e/S12e/Gadd45 family ribosomal protein [Parasporobacterium paucivorans]|uniref:Ribosomal protein L7Ae n=1 Tax=Parasporobacterium paucivorans DSM 15970 TaxID=1122934 RepID=A0A1M6EUH3_9FIRM|nr:ribosomal L7Ae/L30e/S12e/Gadd45 family protein [Parasporobacterium paucivorans]SHI89135.1 Ribosomal protein L7Ae [Parasporobacterium paucivorans DSM 15970]